MTLGEKLRQTRLERGLTQKQVCGDRLTRSMLSLIENGQAEPSMKTLDYLAAALGVTPGWLLADDASDAAAQRLPRARALLRGRDYAGCLALLEPDAAAASDEELLLLAESAAALAGRALLEENIAEAARLAALAADWDRRSLYGSQERQLRALAVLARCKEGGAAAVEAYRKLYLQAPESVRYHLLLARYQLEQEHLQAAEREIWSIAELPDEARAEYLILRGRIAARKEQFENAILYLQQAEQLEPLARILCRELYRTMELCCRETEDFRQAYAYAAKQLEMEK